MRSPGENSGDRSRRHCESRRCHRVLPRRSIGRAGWYCKFLRSPCAAARTPRFAKVSRKEKTVIHSRYRGTNEAMKEKTIIALDVSSSEKALQLVSKLHDVVAMFKIGSQLFTACGPQIVREVIDRGGKVFLDLKFHDIPNTVTHAALEAAALGVSMMTVHASGGRAMMQSVSKHLHDKVGNKKPVVVAITVLTSFDTRALFEIGVEIPLAEQVQRLALFAQECGMDGVVCSPQEIQLVRKSVNPTFKIV